MTETILASIDSEVENFDINDSWIIIKNLNISYFLTFDVNKEDPINLDFQINEEILEAKFIGKLFIYINTTGWIKVVIN